METIQCELRKANIKLEVGVLNAIEQLSASGLLSLGWPHARYRVPRLFWFPEGAPRKHATAIVSSRLGRQLDRQDDIFRILRAACSQLDPRTQMLITAAGTATHPIVSRAAELFGIPILELRLPRHGQSLSDWLMACTSRDESDSRQSCLVSPPFTNESSLGKLRDRLLVLSSHQLLVLHVRPRGTLLAQLSERLAVANPARTFLALGTDQLVPPPVAESLMLRGAVGWFVPESKNQGSELRNFPMDGRPVEPPAPIISLRDRTDEFLTHCTRRAKGAWPDQPDEEFLDELIFGEPKRDRSSLAALVRIVAMRRLLASSESIRGGAEVVSFTAANMQEIRRMRTFRAHRGRWDFEPYGICIERESLQSLGAKPVTYGDESTWQTMSAEERPLFQKRSLDDSGIDWSVEREWRLLGDVDLERIPASQAVVFVPTAAEARHVAQISRWPVAVV